MGRAVRSGDCSFVYGGIAQVGKGSFCLSSGKCVTGGVSRVVSIVLAPGKKMAKGREKKGNGDDGGDMETKKFTRKRGRRREKCGPKTWRQSGWQRLVAT